MRLFRQKQASTMGGLAESLVDTMRKHSDIGSTQQAYALLLLAMVTLIGTRRPEKTRVEIKDSILGIVGEMFDDHFDNVPLVK